MLNSYALETLYSSIPKSSLPWVTRSLSNNETVCEVLKDKTFVDQASQKFQQNPLLWTPGNLALMSLGSTITANDIQAVKTPKVPKKLKTQAAILFEELRNRDFSFLNRFSMLEAGGLIGLHLRVSKEIFQNWDLLFEIFESVGNLISLKKSILSCLFSFLYDQEEFVDSIFRTIPSDHMKSELYELVVYAVFSNSLPDKSIEAVFSPVLSSISLNDKILLLNEISIYSKEVTSSLAKDYASFIEHNPINNLEIESVVLQLANQPEQSSKKFIETYHKSQNQLMEKLIEIGLSTPLEKINVQKDILAELDKATHLSEKNSYGKKLLKAIVFGDFDDDNNTNEDFATKISSTNFIAPESLLYSGLVEIHKDNEEYGMTLIEKALIEIKASGKSINRYLTSIDLIKNSLKKSKIKNQFNEIVYANFPNNEYAKKEVLKTYLQKGEHQKAIPINLSLLLKSPDNSDAMLSLASSYANNHQWNKSYQEYEKVFSKNISLKDDIKFDFAKVCLNNQFFEKAEGLCEELLDEDYEDAHSVLANISKETKNYPKMIEHLNKATYASPEKIINWHELASYYMDKKDIDAADPVVSEALQLFPYDCLLQYFKGVIHIGLKNYDKAIDAFSLSLENFSTHTIINLTQEEILKKLAKALYMTGKYDQLLHLTESNLVNYPDNGELQKYYALSLIQTGSRQEGNQLLETLILNGEHASLVLDNYIQTAKEIKLNLHPMLFDYLKKINVIDLQTQYAEILINQEEFEIALDVLQMEKRHLQSVSVIKHILLCAFRLNNKVLINQYIDSAIDFESLSFNEIKDFANLFIYAKQNNKVLDLALLASSKQEKNTEFILWFANTLNRIDRAQNAIDSLIDFINQVKSDARVHFALGKLYVGENFKTDANNAFEQVLHAPGKNASLFCEIATIYGNLDDELMQVRYLKEALKIEESVEIYYELAMAYQTMDNPFEALTAVQLGLEIFANDLKCLVLQTSLLVELDRPNAAIESINKAIQIAPHETELYKTAVKINLELGNIDYAYQFLPMLEKMNDSESIILSAKIMFLTLHFDEAMSLFDKENEKNNTQECQDFDALNVFVGLLSEKDAKAILVLNKNLSSLSTSFEFYGLQACLLAKQGDLSTATQVFHQGYEIFQNQEGLMNQSIESYFLTIYFAYAASMVHEWAVSAKLFQKAEKIYQAPMIQNYLIFKTKFFARINVALYDFAKVKTHKKDMKVFMKPLEVELHRLQSIKLKCVNSKQVNHLHTLNNLMLGEMKPISSLINSSEVSAFILGTTANEDVKSLFEMKKLSNLNKSFAVTKLYQDDKDFADQVIDTLTGQLHNNALNCAIVAINMEYNDELENSLKVWGIANELWDNEPRWLSSYAKILGTFGAFEDAQVMYKKGLQLDRENIVMILELGELFSVNNENEFAAQHYAKVIQNGSDDSKIFSAYSRILHKIGKNQLAEKMAIRAIQKTPNEISPVHNYAEILIANNEFRKAEKIIHKAKSMGQMNLKTLELEVSILDKQNEFAKAITVLNNYQLNKKLSNSMRIYHAKLYAKNNNKANAIAILDAILKNNPNDTSAAYELFKIYLEENNPHKFVAVGQIALKNISKTLRTEDFVFIYKELAKTLHSQGQLDKAVHYLDEAIGLNPKNNELYLEIANVFVKSRQFSRALNYLQEAARLQIHTLEICLLAADLYEKSMDYIHAEEMLKKASELEPKNVVIKRKLSSIVMLKLVHQRGE